MKKILFGLLLGASVLSASAAVEINTSGLTDAQKAQLVQQAEQMKKQRESLAPPAVETVDQWVDVGERIGKMMGGAAKEVGIAVNEFVKTPVGKMTAFLIIWNYMGSMLVHVSVGLLVFVVTFSILTWHSRRLRTVEVTYDKEAGRNWLGRYPILRTQARAMESDAFLFLVFSYGVSLVISIWIMLTGW